MMSEQIIEQYTNNFFSQFDFMSLEFHFLIIILIIGIICIEIQPLLWKTYLKLTFLYKELSKKREIRKKSVFRFPLIKVKINKV